MPGIPIILGALLIPLLRGNLQRAWMLLLPIVGFAQLVGLDHGPLVQLSLFDYDLNPVRVDKLSLVFGYIFHIALLINVIYSLHVRDNVQHVAGLIYAGSAIGAAFAGDMITLFVYWELTAVTSVFLIWARGTERAYRAGLRYLIIQVGSGVLLLSGVIVLVGQTGSVAFDQMELSGLGTWLIFIAFGIKAAFPLLHGWLQDAYPEATVTGTVFLSAFTTKLAIYALARGFPGTDLLIPIGAAMTAFPIFFAVIENDLRRVLSYSLNNQLGFMVVGIGIGTELSLNGTAAHAFSHILYKALLFMSMGAVLYRTGTIKGSELGGLYKSMPLTTVFCIIGAASISAFPLFSGFISKSLIMSAAGNGHFTVTWLILLFASAGVFHHSGIKIPFFAFFAHDSGIRCKEAPMNMLVAMGIAAAMCIGIGAFPGPLYSILPYSVDYVPYTTSHVVTQMQLLMFSALAFTFLQRTGLYPPELPSINIDLDAIYRKLLPWGIQIVGNTVAAIRDSVISTGKNLAFGAIGLARVAHGPSGVFARTWLTSSAVLVVVTLLAIYLLFAYRAEF
ncbi:MAG: Na(+)/H(+) antiporter subunit D [Gemmatimonadetes bacterium]|nr:Na(+)/H(+) antiporter subunit D [Gemmatimonadota bacterium]MBT7860288.1 Na(+)/H(+) antiporter subunit D [Gemmatimonadota bacterium]